MPTVPKTSTAEILAAARTILEEHGEESLTMQAVAHRVGIRGPSLYKRFADKNAILAALDEETFDRIAEALNQSGGSIQDMVAAYLVFARANPVAYRLLFRAGDPVAASRAARPALEKIEALLGDPAEALLRTRVLTSFLHGYLLIDSSQGFRLGGDPDAIVSAGLTLIIPEAVH